MRPIAAFAALAVISVATPAAANFAQQAQVPNGVALACTGCHPGGDSTQFTVFGAQMRDLPGGTGDWASLCLLDADGDGATNGAELGDPGCVFPAGNDYGNYASDPNDPASLPPPVDPEPEPMGDLGVEADRGDRPTGDRVDNLDDGCRASPTAPIGGGAWVLFAFVAIGWRRRR